MATIVLDTLEFSTKLRAGGFTEQQAETQARALAEVVEKQLVTRQDVDGRQAEIKRDIHESENRLEARVREVEVRVRELELKMDNVKAELKRDIEASRADLIKWVVGVVFGVGLLQLTIITALLLKLSHQVF